MSVRNGLLALLSSRSRHGYELKKELEERTGSLWELNVGQVYTTLSRLERDGLVTQVGTEPVEHGSQDQRQYALTDAGRREIEGWFAQPRTRPAPDRDELVIKLTLAASLDQVDLDAVIDAQRGATTEELQRYHASRQPQTPPTWPGCSRSTRSSRRSTPSCAGWSSAASVTTCSGAGVRTALAGGAPMERARTHREGDDDRHD
ncbi:MAG: PadR family transcriptional regulator [Microthrixaceae bacterium]|nr:PadR family transcriptional regulator [Microthrixaceae bacterium]